MKQEPKSAKQKIAPSQAPGPASLPGEAPQSSLQAILRQTIAALTDLDSERLEAMVAACECMGARGTADDVKGALEEHRVLDCLLAETERNLKFLMRVRHQGEFPEYAHDNRS